MKRQQGRGGRGVGAGLWALMVGLALAFGGVQPAFAQPVTTAQTVSQLHSARAVVAPGEQITLLLEQRFTPGWHSYWVNAGDSGAPIEISWQAPEGVDVGPVDWPTPAMVTTGDVVTFGYADRVVYPIRVTLPQTLPTGRPLTLTADATWLVCADICIPEDALLEITLPVAAAGRDDPNWAPQLPAIRASLPQDLGLIGQTVTTGTTVRLTLEAPALTAALGSAPLSEVMFYPYRGDLIRHGPPTAVRQTSAGLEVTLEPNAAAPDTSEPLAGVLTARQGMGGPPVAVMVNGRPPSAGPSPLTTIPDVAARPTLVSGGPMLSLWAALALALLGGVVLNAMPCVFPVLAVKALSFTQGVQSGQAQRHGLLFFAGVLGSMLLLGGLVIGLRAAGAQLGWGFQLQEPWFVAGLVVLFFLLGLNLLGLFEVGTEVQGVGATLAQRGGDVGAFFTGTLAVIAATPCLAPFMSTAVAWALGQPPLAALAVFAALGVGFALPLTLLAFAPRLQQLLPRPGAWMNRMKEGFAFLMFATAVWLLWVLSGVGGRGALLLTLAACAALGFVVWAFGSFRGWRGRVACVALALAALAGTASVLQPTAVERALSPQPWSVERVAELQAQGQAVFVNFTADWCVTCKVNERLALSSPRVAAAFAAGNVAYLKADWTNRGDDIASELAAHGHAGVPLYLYYAAGSEAGPTVLPQALSEDVVIATVTPAAR